MQIDISYKNIKPDEPLMVFVEKKIGGLDSIIGNKHSQVKVELSLPSRHHRTGPVFYAEANLKMGGNLLRANYQHENLRSAIVEVKNELQRQIKKLKDKKKDSTKRLKK